jgi:hypothetical protein
MPSGSMKQKINNVTAVPSLVVDGIHNIALYDVCPESIQPF